MYDFSCTDPDDMNYEALAKKQGILGRIGVAAMCKIMEDIDDYTELSLDTIKELADQSIQFA